MSESGKPEEHAPEPVDHNGPQQSGDIAVPDRLQADPGEGNAEGAGDGFYVVGIGASAGGFEALEQFFSFMPSDNGMAFVVVQHLSPDHKSLMVELLSKHTEMEVTQATDGMQLKPNCIHLIPPKKIMTVKNGKLFLEEKARQHALSFPIDIFFNSLAKDVQEKSIAIVLSGTGSDGTRGIRSVKEQGGLILVQDLNSAKFDGMPRNAVATGLADYILSPVKMPEELLKYIKHPFVADPQRAETLITSDEDRMSKIFSILRNRTGLDFTHYKQSTVSRRIERRLSVNQVEKVEDYVNYLYQNPREVETLYKELLIGVTQFFRDPEAYALIKEQVIPEIVSSKPPGETIRVWAAGCSTGEEAYSLAILFREYLDAEELPNEVKIFATDVDSDALEFASMGQYPENIAADLSSERFKKYFMRKGDKQQVSKVIREMVIFALHNLIKDPPFNKVDLLSCRNMLIYLQPILQRKVLLNFNFALNEDGVLFLGASETIGEYTNLFSPYNAKWKIYRCQGKQAHLSMDELSVRAPRKMQSSPHTFAKPEAVETPAAKKQQEKGRSLNSAYDALFEEYVPPAAVVNSQNDVLHVLGDVSRFLRLQPGDVSLNIVDLVRKDMAVVVETAMNKTKREKTAVTYSGVQLKDEPDAGRVDLKVIPLGDKPGRADLFVVVFQEAGRAMTDATEFHEWPSGSDDQRMQDLEHELQYTKENLQATIEELETTNEELQATNEELLSANEELQSTNEELQSVNEELITVNSEYQSKIQELTEVNNDMSNLMSATRIGTVFLDRDLTIRKFTPTAADAVNIIENDLGRPLAHLSLNVAYDNLVDDCKRVLNSLIPVEREVRKDTDNWWLVRILPYKTDANTVKGVVVTFIDITSLKEATLELQKLSKAVELAPSIVCITNTRGNIEYVNQRFTEVTGYSSEEATGQNIQLLKSDETSQQVFDAMWDTVTRGEVWRGKFINRTKDGRLYYEEAAVSPIVNDEGKVEHYLKVAEDVTAMRQASSEARDFQEKVLTILESTTDSYIELDADWRFDFVNSKAESLLGQSRNDLQGKSFWEVFPSLKDGELHATLRHALEQGEPAELELAFPKLGKHLEVHAFPINGSLTLYFRDITDRVEAEEALKAEQELIEGVARTSPVSITVVESDGHIIFANEEAEELFGVSAEEITSRNFSHPDWKITTLDGEPLAPEELPFSRVLQSGKPVHNFRHCVAKPGEKPISLSINATPIFDEEGAVRRVVNVISDITADVEHERELRRKREEWEREARLHAAHASTALELMDSLDRIMVGLDIDGTVTLLNKKGRELLGVAESEAMGMDWFGRCIPEKDRDQARQVFTRFMEGDTDGAESSNGIILNARGEAVPIQWHNKPLYDAEGAIYGVLSSGKVNAKG